MDIKEIRYYRDAIFKALGINLAIVTLPVWIPFLVIYWILEPIVNGFRRLRLSRLEKLVVALVLVIVYGLINY